jgi:DMSO/TMAO reductase YedYZ molybdopterin-dependent catalytic subunit
MTRRCLIHQPGALGVQIGVIIQTSPRPRSGDMTAPTLPSDHPPLLPRWRGAVAGLVAAITALAVAQLVAGLLRGTTSPVVSVGEWVIDHVPVEVKDFSVRHFGTNDKPMLIAGTVVLLGVFAVVVGLAAARRLWVGIVGIAAFGLIGMATAAARPGAPAAAVVPALVGALAAEVVVVGLLRGIPDPLRRRAAGVGDPVDAAPAALDRRRFLLGAAAISVVAVAAGGLGRALQQRFDVSGLRAAIRLPAPRTSAADLPADVDLGVDGITPFTTPNESFYRVDTALEAPQVSPDGWSLRIHGLVDREPSFSYQDLLDRPLVERDITLVCISNEVGGTYAGNARWLGVPLADLLHEAGVQAGADQLVSRSVDGWTAGTPTSVVLDGRDALVAVGMNGEPLPVNHGFPARLVVPGVYGYNSATKWLTELELTTFGAYDAYWAARGYAQQGPLKTLTRIDTPRGLASVPAGRVAVGGVAWAIHRGIEGVEVQIDEGPWQPARLGAVPHGDTWRQWTINWQATPGSHTITARSTDGTGTLQPEERAEPLPDGASGWHSIVVLVG